MRALVIGTGAIGSFYGAMLAKAGAEVSVVARSDYEQVKACGIGIRSDTKLGGYHFRPAAVVRHASELAVKPDYVLVCIKVVEGAARVALLRDALGPGTAIVLVSNGVEIEDEIAAAFAGRELISGLASICVTRTAPGQVWHQAFGGLDLGNYPSGLSEKTMALCAAFERAGVNCVPTEEIVTARWQKCVWNAAFNPLSVLSGGLSTIDIVRTQEPLVRAVMGEICQIAAAVGHALPPGTVDTFVEITRTMPAYRTSMLLDFDGRRPMETEAIVGNAVRAGCRAGFASPHLESIYALMKLRELRLAQG
jgi:2-dehydropantoate 2-reductase